MYKISVKRPGVLSKPVVYYAEYKLLAVYQIMRAAYTTYGIRLTSKPTVDPDTNELYSLDNDTEYLVSITVERCPKEPNLSHAGAAA